MNPKKKAALLAALGVLAVAIAFYLLSPPRYVITAGPITGDQANGINGTYKVKTLFLGFGGIESDPAGGACIFFPAKDIVGPAFAQMAAKTCENDQGCTVCPPGADCSTPGKEIKGACEVPTKTCWSRPVGTDRLLCKTSGQLGGAIIVGKEAKILDPGPISVAGIGLKPNAAAVVRARLICSGNKPCGPGGLPYIHVWGTPKTL